MGESRAVLGNIAVAPYKLMGTPALAETVATHLGQANVVMLANHGVLATGKIYCKLLTDLKLQSLR